MLSGIGRTVVGIMGDGPRKHEADQFKQDGSCIKYWNDTEGSESEPVGVLCGTTSIVKAATLE